MLLSADSANGAQSSVGAFGAVSHIDDAEMLS
jgi:hypothetical protein